MKICKRCDKEKDLSEFSKNTKSKDGLQSYCKECQRDKFNNWQRGKTKEFNNNRATVWKKARQIELRKILVEFFKFNPCVDCGNSDPRVLEFDHKDGVDKTATIGQMISAGKKWEVILTEIEKCDVRCANCHRIRTGKQFNYWYNLVV